MRRLRERWRELWTRVDGKGSGTTPFSDLMARYNEPWRAYHTLNHIEAIFEEYDALRRKVGTRPSWLDCSDPRAIEMAIWYHDAVYNTAAKDNEERSAQLFQATAKAYHLNKVFTEKVSQLIVATKHGRMSDDLSGRLLCDMDLSILGQPEAAFDEYERGVRREYGWVPERQFNEGRGAILESFLNRPAIYSTNFFQRKYEDRARKNLVRSIAQLKFGPPFSS